jgi:proton-dependent oligopeptide transporter, POT family
VSEDANQPRTIKDALLEIVNTFKAIIMAPKVLYGINIPYLLEGLVYFGVLTVLAKFLHDDVGLTDPQAGYTLGLLTGGITFAMFFLGGVSDKIGVRKALGIAFTIMIGGRALLALSGTIYDGGGMWSPMFMMVCAALLCIVVAYGLYQPAAYAAIKKYTNKKTAAMGYAMIYALMNLGAFFSGLISPPVRRNFGFSSIFWIYVALTVIALLVTLTLLTKKNERKAMEENAEKGMEGKADTEKAEGEYEKEKVVFTKRLKNYFKEHPFRDKKFVFFIFVLIPVQTLFAHNWLTIPLYIDRAFAGTTVGANFEFFSNLNPIIIFFLAPLVAVLTARSNTYKMMIIGTFVMAAPTFLLVIGPNPALLLSFIVLMSIGEAMWQPRFLQWVAEIAPEGKTGAYMGIAQLPWFMTKFITASYSGWFLQRYCPADGTMNTQTLWLIYALIAMITPVVLVLAKGWIGASVQGSDMSSKKTA